MQPRRTDPRRGAGEPVGREVLTGRLIKEEKQEPGMHEMPARVLNLAIRIFLESIIKKGMGVITTAQFPVSSDMTLNL